MGKIGGSRKSAAKTNAARENAKRPRKKKNAEADRITSENIRLKYTLAVAMSAISTIEERYIDGCDTYEDWKFMGDTARTFLEENTQAQARQALPDAECSEQPKPESKDPHRFCRGGGGNNIHCGCKYDG